MNFISKTFRFIFMCIQYVSFILRILRLKLLYPGITIDFKSKIHNNCSIVCIKGGRLNISNTTISSGTNIGADFESIVTIDDSFIGRNCVITCMESVIIKNGCLIADMVVIRDQNHDMYIFEGENKPDKFLTAPVVIEENVRVSSKATILKGVKIGTSSIIAPSAVVTNNVPAFEIWGGIPAKFIKHV